MIIVLRYHIIDNNQSLINFYFFILFFKLYYIILEKLLRFKNNMNDSTFLKYYHSYKVNKEQEYSF